MDKTNKNGIPLQVRRFIVISVALIIAIAFVVLGFVFFSGLSVKNSGALVYRKENGVVVRLDKLEVFVEDETADNFRFDSDAQRVFFTTQSSLSGDLYDLCFIEKSRSEISEPEIIDAGVKDNYVLAGNKVYYLRENSHLQSFDGCCCDVDSRVIETFSENTENIYALNDSFVYFTKMHSDDCVLYLKSDDGITEVCRNLKNIICYNETEQPHILFEKSSQINKSVNELYISYGATGCELICDNVYSVNYDDYKPNGNLYYFTTSKQTVSWSYVIADQYAQSDADIRKPTKDSFLAYFGLSAEYNEAMQLYEEKLMRDEVREILNASFDNGEISVPAYNCFVYNHNGSALMAENTSPDDVYAVCAHGEPKIVYNSKSVSSAGTDVNALTDLISSADSQAVCAYVNDILSGSIVSNGIVYLASSGADKVVSPLDGYSDENAMFSFSDNGKTLYTFVRDSKGDRLNLFANNIDSTLSITDRKNVDTNIVSYCFCTDSLVYLKSQGDKTSGDIFSFNGAECVKLSNEADSFTVENGNDVIIIKNLDASHGNQLADFYLHNNGEENLISDKVYVDSLVYSQSDKAAYINADNKLYLYTDGNSLMINSDASEILLLA